VARILLVDDDIAEISAVKRVLTRAGHQPVVATNTNDALTSVDYQRPDLVIVGATCEGGEGIALTRKLADDEQTSAIPLIVLGSSAEAAPTASQLPRPVDAAQLADLVRAAIGGSAPAPPAAAPAPRRSASDALLARASQLRQGPPQKGPPTAKLPAPAPRPAVRPTVRPLAPPQPPPREPADAIPPFDQIGDDLEAVLRRAEDAERAHAAERKARARQADRAAVEAAQRAEAEEFAISQARAARQAQERAREEEQRRAEEEQRRAEEERKRAIAAKKAEEERRRAVEARRRAEEEQRRAEEERERATEARRVAEEEQRKAEEERRRAEEEQRRAEEERRRATEEKRRAAEAEQKAREEERRRAEAGRRAAEEKRRADLARRKAEEEARRAAEAEGRARAEEEARRHAERTASSEKETRQSLEQEVERLRAQLDQQRREAESKLKRVVDRAAVEEQAAEEIRRLAAARLQEEADAQVRSAIESARAEMETVRREREAERRRRAEAEAELAKIAEATERLASERAALAGMEAIESEDEGALRKRVQELRQTVEGPSGAPRLEREPHRTPTPEIADESRPPAPPSPELRSGTLAELPAPRLLALAARERLGGRIDVHGDAARTLYFEAGKLVGATSSAPQERLEEVALRLGMLTRDQYRAAAGAVASLPTRRAAVLLLERGYIKPNELTALVRRRTEEVLFGVFADEGARFKWTAEHVPGDERTTLERDTLALAVEGVRRRWLQGRVDAVLGGPGTLLSPLQDTPPIADLGLSAAERRLVQLADGLRTLDEILASSPVDPLTGRQVLAALTLTGVLAVRVLQAGRPASAAATAIDLARVRDKLDQVRRADYFIILGVSRACTPHEVREAADRLLAEFEPRRFAGHADDDLVAKVEEIRRVLLDAREVLADDELREAYVEGL